MLDIKIGDSIGIILVTYLDKKKGFRLHEGKVKSITMNSRGRSIKAKRFNPIREDDGGIDDLEFNTNWMTENPDLILVREPFLITDELRQRVTRWIEAQNERSGTDG